LEWLINNHTNISPNRRHAGIAKCECRAFSRWNELATHQAWLGIAGDNMLVLLVVKEGFQEKHVCTQGNNTLLSFS